MSKNPFKLEDHYDESFAIEDDDDESSLDDNLPQEKPVSQPRPPSARHRSRTQINEVESEEMEEPIQRSRQRPISGKFRPRPPGGRPTRQPTTKFSSDDDENNSSELESTDEDFNVANTRPFRSRYDEGINSASEPSENLAPSNSLVKNQRNSYSESSENQNFKHNTEDSESSESGMKYQPDNFKNLKVSKEVRDLFKNITKFKAKKFSIPTKLKAFIPDYVPAVGDIDAFLKIPRPDGKDDEMGLGWKELDEPSLKQTDPAVLEQYLKQNANSGDSKVNFIHSIKNADKEPKRIDSWINEISKLNKSKPAQTVQFSRPMPDIESIMSQWPSNVEQKLKSQDSDYIPSADNLDCTLDNYSKIVCSLFDIPVHETSDDSNLIQSLHVLFSTYSQFKQLDFQTEQQKEKSQSVSQNNLDSNVMTFD